MIKKMGRPTTPEREAKSVLFGAKLSPPEAKEAERAIRASPLDKSKWLRDAIKQKAANRPIWLRSKWKMEQLDGKLVQFRLIRPEWRAEGVGQFDVDCNERGELTIDILGAQHGNPSHWWQNRFWIFQEDEAKIELHPNQQVADFRLLE
jgi:hypothetical protein